MARIVLLSSGSQGDVSPFVALALGLRAAGHEVVMGAQPFHADFVARHGVHFQPLGDGASVEQYVSLMDRLVDEPNPRKQLRRLLQEFFLPDMDAQLRDAMSVTAGADLVVVHWMQLAGMMAAEMMQRPWITVSLNPVGLRVVAAPQAHHETSRNLGKILSDSIWGDAFHRLRARHGLPAIDSVADYQYSKRLNLLAMSPALLTEQETLELQSAHRLTGFWHLPTCLDSGEYRLPRALSDFLEAPEKPVVISFGSMAGHTHELCRIVIEAVRLAGCRAILQGGWAGLSVVGAEGWEGWEGRLLCVGDVPHDFLFRHAVCVVHHGGAGTTAAALRAGVPSVVVWHMLDQPYWGQLLHRLGCAPQALARYGLNSAALAERIIEAQKQARYRECCSVMALRLAQEDGVANAVALVQQFLESARKRQALDQPKSPSQD